ncbi:F-type conjugal transfer pilus assembly protein TraB [Erwinia billingiae]|uniref:F-type conjugal transfer pilus assembly protein TraB n=1 Tax=Erwinia billingiae TaxID=182337 RepID=UPI00320B3DE8
MANINTVTKRKQIALFVAVTLGVGALVGGGLWISNLSGKKDVVKSQKEKEPAPDLTGVVDTTFNNKVQKNAILQSQLTASEMKRQMDDLRKDLQQLNKGRVADQKRLTDLEDEKKLLQAQLDAMGNAPQNAPAGAPEGEPRPNTGSAVPPPTQFYPGMGTPQTGQTSYEAMPPMQQPGTMDTTTFSYEKPVKNRFPYIPSGSFAESMVVEGADANAAVTGRNDTAPMQFRLTGVVQMPNDKTYDLTGCNVTAEAYGDVSSERAEVRTRSISCIFGDDVVDMKVAGHVSFMGKNGIKGRVVMRNGKILGWAWGAGFLDGIGQGIEKAATPTVGIGATASMGASDVLGAGIGGGTSKAAQTLSDYYIKRAEQYHEIIPIGAGNEVTVVFQDGFQLQTLDEIKKAKGKARATTEEATQSVQEKGRSALNQVNDLKLGDMIHPMPGSGRSQN